MMHIDNTISSNTMKYCIITNNIVSADTFLHLFCTIIHFMHLNYSSTSKWCMYIHFPPPWYIEPNQAEVATTSSSLSMLTSTVSQCYNSIHNVTEL